MNMSELSFTRFFGDAEKNYAINLLKTIAEATDGSIAFPPTMIKKVQVAHDTLEAFKKKKATEKQLTDTFASVGLAFFQWISSTVNQAEIEAAKPTVEDVFKSTENIEAQQAAIEAVVERDGTVGGIPVEEESLTPESLEEYKDRQQKLQVLLDEFPDQIPSAQAVEDFYTELEADAKTQGPAALAELSAFDRHFKEERAKLHGVPTEESEESQVFGVKKKR